ncbi:relaxase/mobilization nuclease domain-containing protein [Bradyrhizobium sp. CCGUVB1N3]|uniref:relaxase/mobilization nuclease domain-containing protein n=1 Tax=Bradyrhizobium sp. CCGUVB1N3 TaxID=2949629 RepID=UPI0020B189FC|nr:relaxase/mobilization nuclease domain-containing protein [Bradyrhizobium sp. CCGUVB1N3]MCP3468702.1 relaxase/mobilization nuclease domain-containing protein [Bradyrhizobium sp. CCGUVB1N3]
MIVKNSGDGKSFAARADYLTHDKDARTDERVEWTKTLNLANDDVPAAIKEMELTAENAELLKQEAGIRGGGRPTEKISKHYSLNWAISDDPTQEHMTEESQRFLRHMGWHEHQAVLIAHNDKAYKHVHILVNAVHPETGLRLNDDFENVRAQAWALQYEREQNRIHCEQREKNANEREKNMPRNVAMEFKVQEQQFFRAEEKLAENTPEIPDDPKNRDWKILKEIQRIERMEFIESGRSEFRQLKTEVYREVREEFRDRWANFYSFKRSCLDAKTLAGMKERILADQKTTLETRRDKAWNELRAERDGWYRDILDDQKEARAELRYLQGASLDTEAFLTEQRGHGQALRLERSFHEAAHEVAGATLATPAMEPTARQEASSGWMARESAHDPDPASYSGDRIDRGIAASADVLLSFFANLGSARPEPISPEERADLFREAAENVTKQQQHAAREEEDAIWRERQKDLFGE